MEKISADADETALIQFVQPLLMKGDNGCFCYMDGLKFFRDSQPILVDEDDTKAMIPFSSDIKLNLIIRRMKPIKEHWYDPWKEEENTWMFIKGAPEIIFDHCSKILLENQEVLFSGQIKKKTI